MNKVADYVLKAVVTLIVGSGGYQLFDGRWFGAATLDSYLSQKKVSLVRPFSDDLYREWGSHSVQLSLSQISLVAMFMSVVLLLGLAAQIIFKANVFTELGRAADAGPSLKRRIWLQYVRFYYWITLLMFLLLTGIYFFMPLGHGLALVFVLISLPSALYLLLYSKDFLQGIFLERFVCTCLLLLLVASLVEWPVLYGKEAFNPQFIGVEIANQPSDSCPKTGQGGPTFLVGPSKDKPQNQFFRVCYGETGDRFIDFFESGSNYRIIKSASLTSVLDSRSAQDMSFFHLANATGQPSTQCDGSLWNQIYRPYRLIVHQPCISVTGTIVDATHGVDWVSHEADGDAWGLLKVDPQFENLLNDVNMSYGRGNLVFEIVCRFPVTQADAAAACRGYSDQVILPPVGSHVRMLGTYVQDTFRYQYMEIHPVTSITVIP